MEEQGGLLERLRKCEALIEYTFHDQDLLRAALTHASGALHRLGSNERLEFLGDAILGLIVCESLYRQFPSFSEGQLTKIKSVVVSRQTCAKISLEIGLIDVLIVGKGISTDRPVPNSLMSDVFESLVAAIYLDGGMTEAERFIKRWTEPEITRLGAGSEDTNFKSILQQIVQRDYGDTPIYTLQAEHGPDHNKLFEVAAHFNGRDFTPAWGRNKKEAEQRAAGNALAELNNDDPPYAHNLNIE